jgi:DNA transformation protein
VKKPNRNWPDYQDLHFFLFIKPPERSWQPIIFIKQTMKAKRLSDLRNLGPKSEALLPAIGIHTPEDLAARGAVDAFIALKQSGVPISLNALWAMEGALTGRDWREVIRTDKLRLLLELEARGIKL